MSNNQNFENIYVYLHHLKNLDGFVTKIREQFANEGKPTFWRIKPLYRALISTPFRFDEATTWGEKALYIFINPLSIIGTTVLGIGATELSPLLAIPFIENISKYGLFIVAGVLYVVSVIKGFVRQLDYNDVTFDLNAFSKTFPDLYQQLRVFKNTEPYSFEALDSHFNRISTQSYDNIANVLDQVNSLGNRNVDLENQLSNADDLLVNVKAELELSRRLFDKAITALQAINAGEITKDILNVFSDFALFKVTGDSLVTIAKQHAYNTPDIIGLADASTSNWAVVKVANATSQTEYLEFDQSHDRVVFANKLVLHGESYVYTFHIPSRHFDEYLRLVTEVNTQTLLYNLVMLYNKENGG